MPDSIQNAGCGEYAMPSNDELRRSFDENPELYDKARPGYPAALIGDIISLSKMPEGGSILEIGCGTGQATLPFAERGYRMLCLDIGKKMAEFAATKFSEQKTVTVSATSFENWAVSEEYFDLVISATAFHWIPTSIGYSKSAMALKKSGSLAVFRNFHTLTDDGFFSEVQPVYQKHAPELHQLWITGSDAGRDKTVASIDNVRKDFDSSGLFTDVIVRRYPWQETYGPDEYISLLSTYSNHIKLPSDRKMALFDGIKDLIQKKYTAVTKDYLAVLWLAQKH